MSRSFNGTTDQIDCGLWNLLHNSTAASWAFWIYLTSNTNNNRILTKWSSSNSNASFLVQFDATGSNLLIWAIRNNGNTNIYGNKTLAGISLNAWTQVTITWNSSSGVHNIYFNGVNQSLGSLFTQSVTNLQASTSHLQFGYESAESVNGFPGRLAEVAIWNLDLTASEAAALAQGVIPYRIRPSALQGYWPLWGLTSPEPDLSGNDIPTSASPSTGVLTGTSPANHAPITPFTRKARSEVEPFSTPFLVPRPLIISPPIHPAYFQ
jgi:hypothetical protein